MSQNIQITTFTPPTPQSPSLSLQLTLQPSSSPDLILSPTSTNSISLSLRNLTTNDEIHLDRLTARDLDFQEDGGVNVGVSSLPRFRDQLAGDVEVKLHVWKGEKLVGSWVAGRY